MTRELNRAMYHDGPLVRWSDGPRSDDKLARRPQGELPSKKESYLK